MRAEEFNGLFSKVDLSSIKKGTTVTNEEVIAARNAQKIVDDINNVHWSYLLNLITLAGIEMENNGCYSKDEKCCGKSKDCELRKASYTGISSKLEEPCNCGEGDCNDCLQNKKRLLNDWSEEQAKATFSFGGAEPGASRFNSGKPRMGLIPPMALLEVAKVCTMGAEKYTEWNWANGFKWTHLADSMMRHYQAWITGQDHDEESGLLHLAHMAWNIMAMIDNAYLYPELDNRPKVYKKSIFDENSLKEAFDKLYKDAPHTNNPLVEELSHYDKTGYYTKGDIVVTKGGSVAMIASRGSGVYSDKYYIHDHNKPVMGIPAPIERLANINEVKKYFTE